MRDEKTETMGPTAELAELRAISREMEVRAEKSDVYVNHDLLEWADRIREAVDRLPLKATHGAKETPSS